MDNFIPGIDRRYVGTGLPDSPPRKRGVEGAAPYDELNSNRRRCRHHN